MYQRPLSQQLGLWTPQRPACCARQAPAAHSFTGVHIGRTSKCDTQAAPASFTDAQQRPTRPALSRLGALGRRALPGCPSCSHRYTSATRPSCPAAAQSPPISHLTAPPGAPAGPGRCPARAQPAQNLPAPAPAPAPPGPPPAAPAGLQLMQIERGEAGQGWRMMGGQGQDDAVIEPAQRRRARKSVHPSCRAGRSALGNQAPRLPAAALTPCCVRWQLGHAPGLDGLSGQLDGGDALVFEHKAQACTRDVQAAREGDLRRRGRQGERALKRRPRRGRGDSRGG